MTRPRFQENQLFLGGEYRLAGKLGEGGMSEVWEAVEVYSGNRVAIKMLTDPGGGFAERFRNEHRFHTELRHPNIVRMLRAGVTGADEGSTLFIVMERLRGITLREAIKRSRRADLLQALHLTLQLADTMSYVHGKGIWHRDLKPENLLVGVDEETRGHLWLLDFGISKYADPVKDRSLKSTDDLPHVATCMYLSPEQVIDRRAVSAQSDIYAFGFIFYELLTRAHPFVVEGVPMAAGLILNAHLDAEIVPVHRRAPELPEAVWHVISACVERDPARRYRSFDQVREALGGLIKKTLPPGHPLAKRLQEEALRAARAKAFEGFGPVSEPLPAAPLGKGNTLLMIPNVAALPPPAKAAGPTARLLDHAPRVAPTLNERSAPVPVDAYAPTAPVVRERDGTPPAVLLPPEPLRPTAPMAEVSPRARSVRTWALVIATGALAALAVIVTALLAPRGSGAVREAPAAGGAPSTAAPKLPVTASASATATPAAPPPASPPNRKAPAPALPAVRRPPFELPGGR